MDMGLPPYPQGYDVRFNMPLHKMQSLFYGTKLVDLCNSGSVHIFGNVSLACRLDVFLCELIYQLFRGARPGKTIPALRIIREAKYSSQVSESKASTVSFALPPAHMIAWGPPRGYLPFTTQELTTDGVSVYMTPDPRTQMYVQVARRPCSPHEVCPYCRSHYCKARRKHKRRGCKEACREEPGAACRNLQPPAATCCASIPSSAPPQDDDTKNNFVRFRGKEDCIEMQDVPSSELRCEQSSRAVLSVADSAAHFRPAKSRDGQVRSFRMTEEARAEDAKPPIEGDSAMGDWTSARKTSEEAVGRVEDLETVAPDVGDACLEHKISQVIPLAKVKPLFQKSGKVCFDWKGSEVDPKLMYSLTSCDTDETTDSNLHEDVTFLQRRLIFSDSDSEFGVAATLASRSRSFCGYPLQATPSRCQSQVLESRSTISLASLRSVVWPWETREP